MSSASSRRALRVTAITLTSVLAVGGAIWAAFVLSPWPSALLIRALFDREAERVSTALEVHLPTPLPAETLNVSYRDGDGDAQLDVYRPADAGDAALPTLVWVHGGAWISGDKSQIGNYLRIIADRGFTVVGVNYSLAPGSTYPTPVVQTMAALDYLNTHADELGVDPERFVLAGDSAGSQIAAQLATIITNPEYAELTGVVPSLAPEQLRAMILTCGAYDTALAGVEGPFAGFLTSVLWSYTGNRNYSEDPALNAASVINYVDAAFPATFITAGNEDPLLPQSEALADRLSGLGVETETLFWPADLRPGLGHEYQFTLDTVQGAQSLESIVGFLGDRTR